MPVIGLVGGIGSGKSSVARWLADRRHLQIINADEIGHAALRLQDIQSQLAKRFGNTIFNESGDIDRSSLAALVFGSAPEQQTGRRDLEAIVHPYIRSTISETIDAARTSNRVEGVILDAAVLLEAGWEDVCSCVVFVDSTKENRRERVLQARGWSAGELEKREASQLSLEEKRQRADFVIANNTDIATAGRELEKILNQIHTSGV